MTTSQCFVIAILLLIFSETTLAQESPDRVRQFAREYSFDQSVRMAGLPDSTEASMTEAELKRYHDFLMAQQRNKVIFSILLGITALIAHVVVLRSFPHTERSANHIVSATGLIYIVFGTIILVVIANTDQQLTASMGILGAVAGYLFGRSQRDQREQEETNGQSPTRQGTSQI